MQMNPESLQALLTKHRCSLTRTAHAIGLTPQRVHQMMLEQGVVIQKGAVIKGKAKTLKARKR